MRAGNSSRRARATTALRAALSTACSRRPVGGAMRMRLPHLHRARRGERLQAAQRNHFAQNAQAIAHELDVTSFVMIPAHRNFAQAQAGALREIKQLNVESKAIDPRGFENRAANIETKRFKSALRVPKRQTGRDAHKQVENAAALLTAPRLVMTDQAAIERARAKGDVELSGCDRLDHFRRLLERRGKIGIEKQADRFLCRQ